MDLSTIRVRITYANMAKLNRIRAAARKHGGHVQVSRYAQDAYDGWVDVSSPWDEGRDQHLARVNAIKSAIA